MLGYERHSEDLPEMVKGDLRTVAGRFQRKDEQVMNYFKESRGGKIHKSQKYFSE